MRKALFFLIENKIMNFISVICLLFLYLWIKPPETFNVNKTEGTLSYFKKNFFLFYLH